MKMPRTKISTLALARSHVDWIWLAMRRTQDAGGREKRNGDCCAAERTRGIRRLPMKRRICRTAWGVVPRPLRQRGGCMLRSANHVGSKDEKPDRQGFAHLSST